MNRRRAARSAAASSSARARAAARSSVDELPRRHAFASDAGTPCGPGGAAARMDVVGARWVRPERRWPRRWRCCWSIVPHGRSALGEPGAEWRPGGHRIVERSDACRSMAIRTWTMIFTNGRSIRRTRRRRATAPARRIVRIRAWRRGPWLDCRSRCCGIGLAADGRSTTVCSSFLARWTPRTRTGRTTWRAPTLIRSRGAPRRPADPVRPNPRRRPPRSHRPPPPRRPRLRLRHSATRRPIPARR